MGRIKDAWRVLRGKSTAEPWDAITAREDERYILRSEAQDLRELTLEASSTLDKLVTLAARLAKRDQRAAGARSAAQGGPDTDHATDNAPAASSKLDLYRRAAALRAPHHQNGAEQ